MFGGRRKGITAENEEAKVEKSSSSTSMVVDSQGSSNNLKRNSLSDAFTRLRRTGSGSGGGFKRPASVDLSQNEKASRIQTP